MLKTARKKQAQVVKTAAADSLPSSYKVVCQSNITGSSLPVDFNYFEIISHFD